MLNIINKIKDYFMDNSLKGGTVAYKVGTPQGFKKRLGREWDRGEQRQAYHDFYHFDITFGPGNCDQILNDFHCTTLDSLIHSLKGYEQTSFQYLKVDRAYGANEDIIEDEKDNIRNYEFKMQRAQLSNSFFFSTDVLDDHFTPATKNDFMKAVDNIIDAARAQSQMNT